MQVLDFIPELIREDGTLKEPTTLKIMQFNSVSFQHLVLCGLNSNLFHLLLLLHSDCRNLNKREVEALPLPTRNIQDYMMKSLSSRLMDSLRTKSEYRLMRYECETLNIQCIIPRHSKSIIDEVDTLLAQAYGFTEEELDFIINHDIKYRMGDELNGAE